MVRVVVVVLVVVKNDCLAGEVKLRWRKEDVWHRRGVMNMWEGEGRWWMAGRQAGRQAGRGGVITQTDRQRL